MSNTREKEYALIIAKAMYEEITHGDPEAAPWDDLAPSFKASYIVDCIRAAEAVIVKADEEIEEAKDGGYELGYSYGLDHGYADGRSER